MNFPEEEVFLDLLREAGGNPALLALAMVDLVHHALPAAERSRVKDALLAAAVPHWCDRAFLAALLETTPQEGDRLLGHLRALTVVEPFPARGEHAVNVHEATRFALREHLRTTDAACRKALSNRALAHVSQSTEAHSRIEALYHLFATDQNAAATACEALDREFNDAGRPEVRHALALALEELTAVGWLAGVAQVEAILASLQLRNWRGEGAQLEAEARNIVALARGASHLSGVGRAQRLLGEVFQTKGRLDNSLPAYRECLAIFEHLAATDTSNAGWQCDLAVAHNKLGQAFRGMGNEDNAQSSFRHAVDAMKLAIATSPGSTDLRQYLANLESCLSSDKS
ncbi:MAG: tetratricopeptide repeat protein [Nitrococcus sp.]|nr:tetratricopeptide repeat protein [Nitrococcus sp.]